MGVTLEALWQKQVTERVIFFEHGSAANGKQTVCFIFLLKKMSFLILVVSARDKLIQ